MLTRIDDSRIKESSGLAWSRATPREMWTCIDEDGYIFRLDTRGKVTAWFRLYGVKTFDTEALAVFNQFLDIGDIGDNDLVRDHISIHRLREPTGTGNLGKLKSTRHDFAYPDGKSRNSEAMMYRASGSLYIASKAKTGELFRHRGELGKAQTLTKVKDVKLPSYVTEGEFSNSGSTLITRRKGERETVFLLDVNNHYRVAQKIPVQRMSQPESLTIEQPAGDAFWIGSEGANSPLVRVRLPAERR
jgi:hypothetical protein